MLNSPKSQKVQTMDGETKQDLRPIALLMKKAREQEEAKKEQQSEGDVEAVAETCLQSDDEQSLEMQDEADRLVRQHLLSGIDKYEDMIRHVVRKQPDKYIRLKPLLRKTWNFWCRNPRMEITYERSNEICENIEAEITKEASEQSHKKYDMKTMKGRLLAAIEDYIIMTEDFGYAEELLLAVWLHSVGKVDACISYNHCQSRTAVKFTRDNKVGFVDGIYWAYDYDNDVLGELSATVLGHEFTHQAVWERYDDSWYEELWSGPSGEVSEELNEALNNCVHAGGCDHMVLDEEPYVDRSILKAALKNTRRVDRFYYIHYVLADRDDRVYFATDKKFDECDQEWYWMIESGGCSAIKVPLGKLREISEDECIDLLLHQKLIVSEEFGDEDHLWDPTTKKLVAMPPLAD